MPDLQNDSNKTRPPRSRSGILGRTVCSVAIVTLTSAHFMSLIRSFEPAISTPDANGYFAQARRIAMTGRAWFEPASPLEYIGIHWLKTDGGRYYCRYPPGLPLIQAAAFRLGGPRAALVLHPVMASLSLLGLFLICRRWVGGGWGLLAAAIVGLNSVCNARAMSGDSHTPLAFFLVWGLVFLVKWETKPRGLLRAFLAGLVLGAIPTIRYPEALFGLGIGLFMLLHLGRGRATLASLAAAAAGAALPIGALLVRNQAAFGACLQTGYSLTGEQTGFGWEYFVRNAVPYIKNIQGEGLGVFCGFGLAGIACMWTRRDTWRRGVLLAGLVLPTTLLYMAYYWSPARTAGATLRFVMPTFLAYAIGAVWLLRTLGEQRRAPALVAAVVLFTVSACVGVPESLRGLDQLKRANHVFAEITNALDKQAPDGSVVIAHRQVQQHLDFIGRWRLADEALMQGRAGRMARRFQGQDEDAPSPMQREKIEEQAERYHGLWGRSLTRQVAKDIWEWAGPTDKVYWVGDEMTIRRFGRYLPPGEKFEVLETLKFPVPDEMADDRPGRRMGPPTGRMRPPMPFGMPMGGRNRRPGLAGGPPGRKGFLMHGEPIVVAEWTRPR